MHTRSPDQLRINEIDAGSELEIDHFHPIMHGGDDEWDNLVYACPACNRNKASYWPSPDTPPHMLLLHPPRYNGFGGELFEPIQHR
jgi:5-methylcytosine-specific restriction endonuclease McrA